MFFEVGKCVESHPPVVGHLDDAEHGAMTRAAERLAAQREVPSVRPLLSGERKSPAGHFEGEL